MPWVRQSVSCYVGARPSFGLVPLPRRRTAHVTRPSPCRTQSLIRLFLLPFRPVSCFLFRYFLSVDVRSLLLYIRALYFAETVISYLAWKSFVWLQSTKSLRTYATVLLLLCCWYELLFVMHRHRHFRTVICESCSIRREVEPDRTKTRDAKKRRLHRLNV